jgi:WD40 repeat protein/serine/threonine protein kinase
MAGRADPSRDLRLGLHALESGAIDREQLIRAIEVWAGSPEGTLAEIFAHGGVLDAREIARFADRVTKDLELLRGESGRAAEVFTSEQSDRAVDPNATGPFAGADDDTVEHQRGAHDSVGAGLPGRRFQVLRPHARGGLGEVFVAFDRELNRDVALKELRARLAHDPIAQARFLLEAQVTGRLEHPGIVPVYSLGRYADGRPYYAMHLIQGETFRDAIERFHSSGVVTHGRESQELAFRRLLRSVIESCNAVAYAHSRGVVHRDLKPDNIMLGPFGETLVVDWGFAKLLPGPARDEGEAVSADSLATDASMTQPGSVMGTPRYMSPEQAAGDLDRVGPASDIYSLGAILYCVLVGHGPFPDGDIRDVLGRVRRGIFPAPRRLRRSVDPALEAICLKAMALDPSDRYAMALDLANELETWLADVRYRGEHELALSQVKGSLARLCLERAHNCFGRETRDEGMLWLARALENAPANPPELQRVIRTSLCGWHVGAKSLERCLRHGDAVHAIAFSPDGRRLATAGENRQARLWDVSTGSTLSQPLKHQAPIRAIAFSPDGKLLVTAGDEGMIRRWDALTGEPAGEPIPSGAPVTALSFSRDGSRIAANSEPGQPFLWDAATGKPVHKPDRAHARVRAVVFSPDGMTIAVACDDGEVTVREAASGTVVGDPLPHGSAVRELGFDPDGRMLLTGSSDGNVWLWDLARRVTIVTLASQGEIRCVAFQPQGGTFATAGDIGTARLRESATGRPIGEPLDKRSRVDCLVYRPDGTMIATGSPDGMVRLWCAATGLPIGPPLEHGGEVRSLAFSHDGRRLAASGSDATVRCWEAPNPVEGDVERIACWIRLTTNLEFDEGDAIRPMDGPTGWDLRRRLSDLGGPPTAIARSTSSHAPRRRN